MTLPVRKAASAEGHGFGQGKALYRVAAFGSGMVNWLASTPSAQVSICSACAMATMARTMAAVSGCTVMAWTKARSILIRSSGRCANRRGRNSRCQSHPVRSGSRGAQRAGGLSVSVVSRRKMDSGQLHSRRLARQAVRAESFKMVSHSAGLMNWRATVDLDSRTLSASRRRREWRR